MTHKWALAEFHDSKQAIFFSVVSVNISEETSLLHVVFGGPVVEAPDQ